MNSKYICVGGSLANPLTSQARIRLIKRKTPVFETFGPDSNQNSLDSQHLFETTLRSLQKLFARFPFYYLICLQFFIL
jgi:hypothetical protein